MQAVMGTFSDQFMQAQDLPEEEGGEEEELPGAKVPKADLGDLRQLLRRKTETSGLFSSADAFIPLSFDDEEEEEEEGEEEGDEEGAEGLEVIEEEAPGEEDATEEAAADAAEGTDPFPAEAVPEE